jgi:mRNA-degrading endonuclease YafQ of YafQ-DinJ toxin-antitoxin module
MKKELLMSNKKEQLEAFINEINGHLNSPRFKEPFQFIQGHIPRNNDFKSATLKEILEDLRNAQIGFDYNLVLQLIEQQSLEKFNEIINRRIKGISMRSLMELRHEVEKYSLEEDKKEFEKKLAKLPVEEKPVAVEKVEPATELKSVKKKSKK